MSNESNVLGFVFAGFVLLMDVASITGCGALIFFKVRAISISIPMHELLWWFVVCAGAFGMIAVISLYLAGLHAEKFAGMILIGSIPYFAPMIAAGLVALLLRK